jgi:tRNA threonylcarbamoyladenosine biosynthesis protein TsaB
MSIILNIDTSLETASVIIAKDGVAHSFLLNEVQKDHASFLHKAVKQLLTDSSLQLTQVDAIAVVNGPGSYTGLRVGLSAAKGFCYALNKPLITVGTLNVLATAAINSSKETMNESVLFCPMIDARRSEVYTAVFDKNMHEILPPCAMILNKNSFEKIMPGNKVVFFGNGASKWKKMAECENALFINELHISQAISELSHKMYIQRNFTDLSYSEPLYIKEFFSP